jgi:hypothetical protein
MKVRVAHLVVPMILAAGATAACSAKAPPPDAYVAASATGTSCNFSGMTSLLQIGSDISDGGGISDNPTRVSNGTDQGGTVSLSCSVKSAGNGQFNIALSAELVTNQQGAGGSMIITGTVDSPMPFSPDEVAAMGTIQAAFGHASNSYTESDCTITLPTNPPNGGPVASGRIWGKIDCPNAVLAGQTTQSGNAVSCDISALFVFENCGS